MKLRDRLSDREIAQLQVVCLREPLPAVQVVDPAALVDLLGKGLVRQERGSYLACWDAFPSDGV
jgi:hypothetical protein